MPVSDLHRQVASAALAAAAGQGFALAGGNALLAYGIITRPTQDVDLFTDQEHGVEQAAATVEAALRRAGFAVERVDEFAGLADIFPGMGEGLAEWIVASHDGQELRLQLAYFDRTREPVTMDVGAVLDVQDVAGGKVRALAGFSEQSMGTLRFGCCRRSGVLQEGRSPNAADATSGNEEKAGDPFGSGSPLSVASRYGSLQPRPAKRDIPVSAVVSSSGHSVL